MDKKTFKKIINQNGLSISYILLILCHIHNLKETFDAIEIQEKWNFYFRGSLIVRSFKKNSYDQFYDEHAYVFSLTALKNLTRKTGLEIFKVEKLKHMEVQIEFLKKKLIKKYKFQRSI